MKKLGCKLQEEDIERMRLLRNRGLTFISLSKVFNVGTSACFYWCVSDSKRNEMIKKRTNHKKNKGTYVYYKNCYDRWYKRGGKSILKKRRELYRLNREKVLKRVKQYYWKNKQEVLNPH